MSDRSPRLTKVEAEAFQRRKVFREGQLVIWCITTGTKDFGDRYVARPTVVPNLVANRSDGYLIADSLEGIRAMLPYGLTRLDRAPQDDPVIVETWF